MKTILLLTDFSKKAEHAAMFAIKLAAKAQARILLYHAYVIPDLVPLAGTVITDGRDAEAMEKESESRLQQLAQKLKDRSEAETGVVHELLISYKSQPGSLADTISDLVRREQVWMIVMGTKGDNGISNFLFGSNAFATIDRANCPVLLVPPSYPLKDIKKTALATDLKIKSEKGIAFLKEFAGLLQSEIIITHVNSHGEIDDGNHDESRQALKELTQAFAEVNSSYKSLAGDEVETKLEQFSSDEQIDVLTLIHRKRNFLERIFNSSTTRLLIAHSKTPLLVLPAYQ